MSEAIKQGLKKRWPKEVAAAFKEYYPGEEALLELERAARNPAHMVTLLRLAAIAHFEAYPADARRGKRERVH